MWIVESISERAARWAVLAEADSLELDQQRELEAWLDSDPRHRGAYVRARARLIDLDRLAALHGRTSPSHDDPAQPPVAARPTGVPRRRLLVAAITGIVAVGGGSAWWALHDGSGRYVSDIGEIRRIALEDGSTLLLNTASEVKVMFTPQERRIRLIRGEALFEVAHDRARPFSVLAKDTAVRAVGTAFTVRLEPTQLDVTVTEGVVEVAQVQPAPGLGTTMSRSVDLQTERISANERIVIAPSRAPEVQPVAPIEVERKLAWRSGMVSFDGESLGTAVAEINRHNRRQIVVADPTLAAKPVIGIFRTTDLQGFSAAAAASLKARAVEEGDVIRLEPALPH
jgi:transmembrane sensor